MKFKLEIELGNDAMRTGEAVAAALTKQAEQLATWYRGSLVTELAVREKHKIRDVNGNTVGYWGVRL